MVDVRMSYSQLRQILSLVVKNGVVKARLEEMLSGKISSFSELELVQMIAESNVDGDIIRILSGTDPDNLDAIEGMEYLAAFFAYIGANKEKLSSWLASTGLAEKGAVGAQ